MVLKENIDKYSKMEEKELRLWCMALDTENNILKAQVQSVKDERNKLMKRYTEVAFADEKVDSRPQNSGLPPVPKLTHS